jgi:hypothetical protein
MDLIIIYLNEMLMIDFLLNLKLSQIIIIKLENVRFYVINRV